MRTIGASEFKAKCLAILDEVARTGETVVVLKRGKEVARLVPPLGVKTDCPQETLRATVHVVGDILSPAVPPETWDANRGQWEP